MPDISRLVVEIDASQIQQGVQAFARFEQGAKGAKASVDGMKQSTTQAQQSVVRVTAEFDKATRAVSGTGTAAKKATKDWTDMFHSLLNAREGVTGLIGGFLRLGTGAYLTGRAFQQITQIFNDTIGATIRASAEFETLEATFSRLLGSTKQGSELLDFIEGVGTAMPVATKTMTDATKVLLGYGFAADEVKQALLPLVNLSMGDSEALNHIAVAYGQVRAQHRAYMQDIRQFTNAGIPMIEALATALGKTPAEIADMIENGGIGLDEINSAMSLLTGETGRFHELTQSLADTWNGQMKMGANAMKLIVKDMGDNLTTKMLPALKAFVSTLNGLRDTRIVSDFLDGKGNVSKQEAYAAASRLLTTSEQEIASGSLDPMAWPNYLYNKAMFNRVKLQYGGQEVPTGVEYDIKNRSEMDEFFNKKITDYMGTSEFLLDPSAGYKKVAEKASANVAALLAMTPAQMSMDDVTDWKAKTAFVMNNPGELRSAYDAYLAQMKDTASPVTYEGVLAAIRAAPKSSNGGTSDAVLQQLAYQWWAQEAGGKVNLPNAEIGKIEAGRNIDVGNSFAVQLRKLEATKSGMVADQALLGTTEWAGYLAEDIGKVEKSIKEMQHLKDLSDILGGDEAAKIVSELEDSLQDLLLKGSLTAYTDFFKALGSGDNAGNSFAEAVKKMADELPMLLALAGARLCAEGNWPVGLSLLIASGVVSVGAGMMSTASSGNESFSPINGQPYENANGGVYPARSLSQYSGRVYSSPQLFNFARGAAVGQFAEAGYEGILPLATARDGRLGVRGTMPPVTFQLIDQTSRSVNVAVEETVDGNGNKVLRATIRDMVKGMTARGELDAAMKARYDVNIRGTRVL